MKKKFISAILIILSITFTSSVNAQYEWAKEAVEYCVDNHILTGMENGDLALGNNITKEQMAKIFVDAFSIKDDESGELPFSDVSENRWSYKYIMAFRKYLKKQSVKFNPEECVTREEFASSLVLALGFDEDDLENSSILKEKFSDYKEVDKDYKKLLGVAVEKAYYVGDGEKLRAHDLLTRAEACSLLYRAISSAKKSEENFTDENQQEIDEVEETVEVRTPLLGKAQVSLEDAKAWAIRKGADQRFIDVADIYWKYGELTGIRPEILYAQAAKETKYGKYGGRVIPEQNNWAGIKTKTATGDETYDHESFATPDDGVRAHFNHMSAYIGIDPVGEPHDRYYLVKTIKWAGTVKFVEELGGKWCPDLTYGESIINNYLNPMLQGN